MVKHQHPNWQITAYQTLCGGNIVPNYRMCKFKFLIWEGIFISPLESDQGNPNRTKCVSFFKLIRTYSVFKMFDLKCPLGYNKNKRTCKKRNTELGLKINAIKYTITLYVLIFLKIQRIDPSRQNMSQEQVFLSAVKSALASYQCTQILYLCIVYSLVINIGM